jgi:hypothetical protein
MERPAGLAGDPFPFLRHELEDSPAYVVIVIDVQHSPSGTWSVLDCQEGRARNRMWQVEVREVLAR